MNNNDGGPAFPRPQGHNGITHDEEHTSNHCELGMSLRDYYAGQGATHLPFAADEELWSHFRNNAHDTLEAVRDYDAYMARRDWRFADAMLAERDKKND